MPLSNSGNNYIKAYGEKKFPYPTPANKPQASPFIYNPQQSQQPTENKYKFMEMVQEKPERDVEGEEALKKRARNNAIGKAFGALGQLGGMAAGGDAVEIEDGQSPFIMQQSQFLDTDYRERLQEWGNKNFQTEQFNTQLQNQIAGKQDDRDFSRETSQNDQRFRTEERMGGQEFTSAQSDKANQQQRDLVDQKAKRETEQFYRMDRAAQDKAMRDAGVDPRSPNAMQEYTQGQKNKVGKSNSEKAADPEFVGVVRRGRDKSLQELRNQLANVEQEPVNYLDPTAKGNKIKSIQDRIKMMETLKVTADNQVALDLYDIGMQSQSQPQSQETRAPFIDAYLPQNQSRTQQAQPGMATGNTQGVSEKFPSNPPGAGSVSPEQRTKIINSTILQIKSNKEKFFPATGQEPDYVFIESLIKQYMDAGLYETENEAFESIIELAENAE